MKAYLRKYIILAMSAAVLTGFLPTQYACSEGNWWDANYQYCRQLTVKVAPGGYTVKLVFDSTTTPSSEAMYDASVSTIKGEDFRIVYNGTEIDRDVTSFTSSLIEICFKLQADIIGNPDFNSYILYYGNSSAVSPPANKQNVYLWFDDFNRADKSSIAVEASYNIKTGGGTWSIEANQLKNVGASGDPNKLIISALGSVNKDIDMLVKLKVASFAGGDLSRMGLSCSMESTGYGYCGLFHEDANSLDLLNDLRSWGTAGTYSRLLNTWYYMRFRVINPAAKLGKVKVWQAGTPEPGTWIVDGNFGSGSARTYGMVGLGGSRTSDVTYFDDLVIRYITEPEPSVSSGPEEEVTSPLPNQPPTAEIAANPLSGEAPLDIHFTSAATDPDGYIVSYLWDFGDGQTQTTTANNITHTYTATGAYQASVTVRDNGNSTTISATVNITVSAKKTPPQIQSYQVAPLSGEVPLIVAFTCTAVDSDGSIVSYRWDFGDAQTDTTAANNTVHTYNNAGTYTTSVTVKDDDNLTATSSILNITASPEKTPPQILSFSVSPLSGEAPLAVTLNCAATDSDGSIVSYAWNFGDGQINTTTANATTHIYQSAGTCTAFVTVKDNDNLTSTSASASINITAPVIKTPPQILSFSVSPLSGEAPLTVTFSCTATDSDGSIVSYAWDFGDGQTTTTAVNTTTHIYQDANTYTTHVTVKDNDNLTTTSSTVDIATKEPTLGMPKIMRFQGNLKDSTGTPLNGPYAVTFKLYDVEAGGTPLWEEKYQYISIENGILDVELGSVTALDLPFDKQYWLGVTVESDEEMSPRFKLTSVPYSFAVNQ